VLNRAGLLRVLREADASVAAFSGYGLAIRCPAVSPLAENEREALWAVVRKRYGRETTIERFGQAETTLRILWNDDGNGSGERNRNDGPGRGTAPDGERP